MVWSRFWRQILYFLSGLTCTDENFITKAGAPRVAAAKGIALVCPDTSPRGANIEGEDESWDFGTGAGFYVNATEEPWSANYKMYTYVTEELPALLAAELPLDVSNASVTGHSMGGHGALVVGLKNPVCPAGYRAPVLSSHRGCVLLYPGTHQAKYKSVSAFAPICHPSSCPWGVKAFTGSVPPWLLFQRWHHGLMHCGLQLVVCVLFTGGRYLGTDEAAWEVRLVCPVCMCYIMLTLLLPQPYDATLLMQASAKYPNSILIDQVRHADWALGVSSVVHMVVLFPRQGTDDSFYTGKQLLPEAFLVRAIGLCLGQRVHPLRHHRLRLYCCQLRARARPSDSTN